MKQVADYVRILPHYVCMLWSFYVRHMWELHVGNCHLTGKEPL
jgi:hypothetical protein